MLSGKLAVYVSNNLKVYKCPADRFLSPAQANAGFPQRVRSLSMNSIFGRFRSIPADDPTAGGRNWGFQQYMQYLKQTQVPKPAKTWLFLDEHPDSINDGYFINNPGASNWQDVPASYHCGACGFSFADGHSEIKMWKSRTSKYPVRLSGLINMTFDAAGRNDFAWYLERTGYVEFSTGKPAFNY